ncbi:hypothetical protein FC756_27155 [Lysinibacillus mangiferihumi]|uniref:Transposase n=1 Tax=Lysinibacillus mangiferihumi TaxID=1130819 RepID=A0A4U2XYZ1_9BACI|nr:hypothetical protein [Lysinibacillus mangiferihumi]TKI52814.1 hypothetical protein FC756_27155 [Lysinibacillus mangiferihumi]
MGSVNLYSHINEFYSLIEQHCKQLILLFKEKVLPVVKKAAQATTKAVKNAVKPKNLLNTLQVGSQVSAK